MSGPQSPLSARPRVVVWGEVAELGLARDIASALGEFFEVSVAAYSTQGGRFRRHQDESTRATLESAARELGDLLAAILNDPDHAATVAVRADFPKHSLPSFTVASVFWATIIGRALSGASSLPRLAEVATEQFPRNRALACCAERIVEASARASAERGRATEVGDHAEVGVLVTSPDVCRDDHAVAEVLRKHPPRGPARPRLIVVLVAGASGLDLPRALAGAPPIEWHHTAGRELAVAVQRAIEGTRASGRAWINGRAWRLALLGTLLVFLASLAWYGPDARLPPAPLEPREDELVEAPAPASTGAVEPSDPAPPEVEADVPPALASSCMNDGDCGPAGHCVRDPGTSRERLGSVVKTIDRASHSELIGRACSNGRRRVGSPRAKLDAGNGSECRVKWHSTDETSCEVDTVLLGPAFAEVRCTVYADLRRAAARGRCRS